MKILWFCNIILPQIAKSISKPVTNTGGWIVGLSDSLLQIDEIELAVSFPINGSKSIVKGKVNRLKYYGFPKTKIKKYTRDVEKNVEKIIDQVNPDIIHIFGTEFPHSLAVVNACERLGILRKAVINIQGLVSIYAKHYYAGLPANVINNYTFRDFVKQNNIKQQRKDFEKRGIYEIEAIKKAYHIIGRTDWDKACTTNINPSVEYHHCNEILRSEFYSHRWDIKKCERYSIFISQATYPIKGLHIMLEAMPEIIKRYPDAHLYIAGHNITDTDSLVSRAKTSSYGIYVKKLIEKYALIKHITFTGLLDEKGMRERFLKSHVFVSPSSIENSPNSLGEAMILGMPCVASDVGGVRNQLMHNVDGLTYQYDAPYMLAYYICKILNDDAIAINYSTKAKEHAGITHNKMTIVNELLAIYKDICIV